MAATDTFALGRAQVRNQFWPALSSATAIQFTIHAAIMSLIIACHLAVLAIRIVAALKRRETFWIARVVHRPRGCYVICNALLVYVIPASFYFIVTTACVVQQRWHNGPHQTAAKTLTAAMSALATAPIVCAGWLSTTSMLFSLLDSVSNDDDSRASRFRRLPSPLSWHVFAYAVPILALVGGFVTVPFVVRATSRLYRAADEIDDLLSGLVGTSVAAIPPATAARLAELGTELERRGARVLFSSKATILQSKGFALICLTVWPIVTVSFLLALRHIARADSGLLRLSLRTALSAPDRDRGEKLNPTFDARSVTLRRRYQLVALQSVLFLAFATGQAIAGVLATIAVFGGTSFALTQTATQVVYWVDDVIVLPLAAVLIFRTVVGLRAIPESVGQPSIGSADSSSRSGPAVEVSLADMLRTPRSRSSLPPRSTRSHASLPEFLSEPKVAEDAELRVKRKPVKDIGLAE